MANILFVNANLNGHINPTLPLVKELSARGNQVDYFCSQQFKEKVNSTGAEFLGYSKELEEFLLFYRPTDRHPFYMLMEYILLYTEAVLPFIIELIRKKSYDMIICDSLFGAPTFLKHILKIPVVSSHSSFAMKNAPVPPSMLEPGTHPQLDHCYEILDKVCKDYCIPRLGLDEVFISKAEWNIVYTIPEFNGDVGPDFRKYLFTGAAPQKAYQELKDIINPQKLPFVYISLGSINTDFIEFYKMCMEAFKDSNYFVVMSIGNKCSRDQLGAIPDNFYVGNFLPQIEILMQTDAFITHAGFNSVSEDSSASQEKVQTFVDAYNTLIDTVDSLTTHGDDSTSAGVFAGDAGLSSLANQLDDIAHASYNGVSIVDYGITLDSHGHLQIDSDQFNDEMAKNPDGLTSIFVGDNSMVAQMDDLINTYTDSSNGIITLRQQNIDDQMSKIQDEGDQLTDTYNANYDRYLEEYTNTLVEVYTMKASMAAFA